MPVEEPHSGADTDLLPYEVFWRDHQKWLQSCGYMLRPRYMPDWVPSWKGTKKLWIFCEDGQEFMHHQFIDATRISDGALVALKTVSKSTFPYEADIGKFFSSDPLVCDPRNHCVPVYEILQVPDDEDVHIVVMPFLRRYNDPRFDTVGEVIAFLHQAVEGLQFMHQHLVAHRDLKRGNIMMDPTNLYPESFHPVMMSMKKNYNGRAKHYTRTQRPTKYYYIDFGLSRRYRPDDIPPLEPIIKGGDQTVPEFQDAALERNPSCECDPFPTDIYCLGNLMREHFVQKKKGFEFLDPLVSDMVQEDPEKRPSIDEVASRFEVVRNGLNSWKLRSRVVSRKETGIVGFFRGVAHWTRRIHFVILRVPPVPTP